MIETSSERAIAQLTVTAEAGASRSKGRTPMTTSIPTTATIATASSEERPSSLQ